MPPEDDMPADQAWLRREQDFMRHDAEYLRLNAKIVEVSAAIAEARQNGDKAAINRLERQLRALGESRRTYRRKERGWAPDP
jgi:hypothetical protein